MKRLFDYCFYRIALFYKKRMPLEDYITQGHTLLVSALGFYAVALANIILHQFGIALTKEIVIIVIVPFCILVFFNDRFFPNSEHLFEELQSKFEEERLKWLKGFLVFLFLIGSLACMILSYHIK